MTSQKVNKLLSEARWDSWQVAENMYDLCKYLFNDGDLDTIIEAMEYKMQDEKHVQKRKKKILATALLMRKVSESYQ